MSAHLYIHIPFCRSKCLYCDFYSVPRRNIPWGRFIDALLAEARHRAHSLPAPPDTVYLGGGTPSLIPPHIARTLLKEILRIFAADPTEITIELNPDDVTEDYIRTLRETGFNRFSMGIQSFQDNLLRTMGRRHNAPQALQASNILIHNTPNVSIDLIFGLPGQTWENWCRDIDTALRLRPPHISCYALMLEEGTPLTRLVDNRRLTLPHETITARMYTYLCNTLTAAGYRHYEISNFAIPGYESRHNSSYWQSRPYLGLGPGAHSYDGHLRRTFNPSDTQNYISRYADNTPDRYTPQEEILTETDLRHEYLLTRLRTDRGISIDSYTRRFGPQATRNLLQALRPHLSARTIIPASLPNTEAPTPLLNAEKQTRLRIPEDKWLIADTIISDLF